jgi:hypothetical protein
VRETSEPTMVDLNVGRDEWLGRDDDEELLLSLKSQAALG